MGKKKDIRLSLKIKAPTILSEVLKSLVFEHGCKGIEEKQDGFVAYFSEGVTEEEIREIVDVLNRGVEASGLEGDFLWDVEEIPAIDWSVQWKVRFQPVRIGKRLIVIAPWHNVTTERIRIVIEPSMAFGTGEHPTTQLCLEEIERICNEGIKGSLLDIGTGSGILAIAASKLGFSDVVAIDIDPIAVEIARKNILINRTENIKISETPLERISKKFYLIVANLTTETIKSVFPKILKCMDIDSRGILSGILDEQKDEVLALLRVSDCEALRIRRRGDWCAVVFSVKSQG